MTDTYAGLPVRRNLFACDDWQRMAEDLMAFQDVVQEALGTEETGDVLAAIKRLKVQAANPTHVLADMLAEVPDLTDEFNTGWCCALNELRHRIEHADEAGLIAEAPKPVEVEHPARASWWRSPDGAYAQVQSTHQSGGEERLVNLALYWRDVETKMTRIGLAGFLAEWEQVDSAPDWIEAAW